MQFSFGQDNGQNTPKKILDVGPKGAYIGLQVLDASNLHFSHFRETLMQGGSGNAAPNNVQGFQLKALAVPQPIFFWWIGELWGVSDTPNGLIFVEIAYKLPDGAPGGGGCGGGCGCDGKKNPPEIP